MKTDNEIKIRSIGFKSILIFFLALLFILPACTEKKTRRPELPNIVLIMADDIGVSDIGCYGSEIQTPNIDRLADEGLRFVNFYNMAKCDPTRSTLLTGLYKGGNGAVHIAQLTGKAGYFNIMSGKEHFNKWVPDYCRAENVFDHSFYFWATTEYFLPSSGKFERPFFLEGRQIEAGEIVHQQAPMYKTDFITDYALKWLDEAFGKDKPFFLYLPYHAAHFPLQARAEDIAKYRGKYLEGWDKLRKDRFQRMKVLDILPENSRLSPPEGNLNILRKPLIPAYTDYYPWETRSEAQKDSLDLEMAVFAAMVDRLDQNIGRVLEKLDKHGKLENTLVMFLIDNGSCPYYTNKIKDVLPGPADSYWSLRAVWANLGNTPYRQYKQFGLEGGSHTPFIARWPGVIEPGTKTKQVGHIVDIAPTLLDIMRISYPDSINGFPAIPLQGQSLLPVFEGKERKEPAWFISGMDKFRMFRRGAYKIVRINGGPWELYNIRKDPTELDNLAAQYPDTLAALAEHYERIQAGFKQYSIDSAE